MTLKKSVRPIAITALTGAMAGLAALSCSAVTSDRSNATAHTIPALTLPSRPPQGAVILLSGKPDDLRNNWVRRNSTEPPKWVLRNGAAVPMQRTDITSKQEFGDHYMHVEFRTPVDEKGNPSTGGNAGVGVQGRYEIQILNDFGRNPSTHGSGSLYSQKAPRVNASRRAGEWQSYDIIFRAPRFDDDGKVIEPARATLFQNGILVQNNEAFRGPTGIQYGEFKGEAKTGPIVLQGDHDPVQFRNIWVVPL
ncbi:MAG: DUF1080 domain-containing protein [Armatimonadetes bacterium]|nr:DUF1080 domain-containing protein [Armatimonadota bacterium]